MTALIKSWRGALNQSAADTDVSRTINTGLGEAATKGWLIRRIEFQLESTFVKAWAGVDVDMDFVVRRGEPDANVYAPSNKRHIAGMSWAGVAQTAVGFSIVPTTKTWDAPPDFVVSDAFLGVQLSTTGSGQANSGYIQIYYDLVSLTQDQVLLLRNWQI